MSRLSDIQTIILSTASQRPDGNLLPAPDSIGRAGSRIHKSLSALLKRGFAAENPVSLPDRAWREEGDRHIGLVLTASGRKAIGLEPDARGDHDAKGEDGQSKDKLQAPANKRETGSITDHPPKMPGTVRADSKQDKTEYD